ncbi:hypothetical protein [Allomesorhizobium alhagi]|jgi:hypothetical protein|uniref:Transmembrane anchored protein n=1 Tax=Mesorhizobium alhagi CCNWXJ12-2 TaxID=1107882 RepID=H0HW67_9HYPH|nr:hypothetical protein [Mesorhizobium alhagi]EHK55071.1 hypothetical protein MAXJ12_22136 [Mesorhizobium alhagi CCNWXJ12-2]
MNQPVAADGPEIRTVDSSLMFKVFCAFALLALLSAAISAGGRWFGRSIAMAGHTDDKTLHEIVIGNDVIAVPANAIRFERARRDGIASRLDLYLRWPEMSGYSTAAREDFNHAGGSRRIIFLSFEERMMSRDMSGRFAPIYSSLIVKPGIPGPNGVMLYGFTEKSGYLNEVLAVAERPGDHPFVARCLSGSSAEESLAPCERDVQVGENLSLSYRFPKELLADWRALDAAVLAETSRILKTAR